MTLSGEQVKQLHKALLSAFPSVEALRKLVRMKLDQRLDEIVGGKTLSEIVFTLIEWVEARGRVVELITKAHQVNPGNQALRNIAESFLCVPASQTNKIGHH